MVNLCETGYIFAITEILIGHQIMYNIFSFFKIESKLLTNLTNNLN